MCVRIFSFQRRFSQKKKLVFPAERKKAVVYKIFWQSFTRQTNVDHLTKGYGQFFSLPLDVRTEYLECAYKFADRRLELESGVRPLQTRYGENASSLVE